MSYQGWSNYPTWDVALWLDNDEGLYHQQREWAEEAKEEAKHSERTVEGLLADKIKEFVEDKKPELPNGMYSDMLTWAVHQVDWCEIATGILEE